MNHTLPANCSSSSRRIFGLLLVSIATLVLLLWVPTNARAQENTRSAPKRPAAHAAHPKIAPGQECAECHQRQTKEWDAGPHGQNQVKCLVCHGAVEEGFMAKPPVSRCESCHDRQVAQLKTDSFMKAKTCFTCHPPHALKPHQDVQEKSK